MGNQENSTKMHSLMDRDYMSSAIILAHEARNELTDGRLRAADEVLAVQQRILLMAGAKDIGQLRSGRELPDDVYIERAESQRKLQRKKEEVEELENEINELRSELDDFKEKHQPQTVCERIASVIPGWD